MSQRTVLNQALRTFKQTPIKQYFGYFCLSYRLIIQHMQRILQQPSYSHSRVHTFIDTPCHVYNWPDSPGCRRRHFGQKAQVRDPKGISGVHVVAGGSGCDWSEEAT